MSIALGNVPRKTKHVQRSDEVPERQDLPGPTLRGFLSDFALRHPPAEIVGDTHRDKRGGQSRMKVVFKQTQKDAGMERILPGFPPPRPVSQITSQQYNFPSRIPSLPPQLGTALGFVFPLSVRKFGCARLPRPLLSHFTDRPIQHRHRSRCENHFLPHNR